jgi:hypothetical protein
MPIEPDSSTDIMRAFTVAFLLARNITVAECAVLQAIESLKGETAAPEELLRGSIVTSLRYNRGLPEIAIPHVGCTWTGLPPTLQNVLKLNTPSRSCFVLRILLHLPLDVCARMLQLQPYQVNERTQAAMQALAAQKSPLVMPNAFDMPFMARALAAQEIL